MMKRRRFFNANDYIGIKRDLRICIADVDSFSGNLNRPLNDDFVVYCRAISIHDDGMHGSIPINNHCLHNYLKITEDELYQIAYENTLESMVIKTLPSMVNTLFGTDVTNSDCAELNIYVITNSEMFYGAGAIAVPEVRRKIGNLIQSDFFILPSSKHEVIIVPDIEGVFSAGALNDMVKEVNETIVKPSDVLSCKVQHCKMDGTELKNAVLWEKMDKNNEKE